MINRVTSNNINFSGCMLPRHVDFIRHINPSETEAKLKKLHIDANFKDNKLVAGLFLYATQVIKKLHCTTPRQILVHTFKKRSDAALIAYPHQKTTYGGEKVKKFSVGVSKKYYDVGPKRYNTLTSYGKYEHGTTHFLALPIHEFMHTVLFKKLNKLARKKHMCLADLINQLDTISLKPFKKEIREKIGSYGTTDACELHAVYWAKEICKSLNGNLSPKYNPFKFPQIKLSKKLRLLIDKISKGDIKGAQKIADKLSAKK